MQVAVEARFITLSNNFLEEIGVDLDIILNQGNAGIDQTMLSNGQGGFQQAINPTTGTGLLQSRRQTQLGFLPQAPAYGQTFGVGSQLATRFSPSGRSGWFRGQSAELVGPAYHCGSVAEQHRWPRIAQAHGYSRRLRAAGLPGVCDVRQLPRQHPGGFPSESDAVGRREARLSMRPRLTVYSGYQAEITVQTSSYYIISPGQLPVGGTGLNGQAATGRPPAVSMAPSGRTFSVTPTVSATANT